MRIVRSWGFGICVLAIVPNALADVPEVSVEGLPAVPFPSAEPSSIAPPGIDPVSTEALSASAAEKKESALETWRGLWHPIWQQVVNEGLGPALHPAIQEHARPAYETAAAALQHPTIESATSSTQEGEMLACRGLGAVASAASGPKVSCLPGGGAARGANPSPMDPDTGWPVLAAVGETDASPHATGAAFDAEWSAPAGRSITSSPVASVASGVGASHARAVPTSPQTDATMSALGALGALAALVILYRRLRRPDALVNPVRRQIFERIGATPGATAGAIARALGVNRRTVLHHVAVLREFGAVTAMRVGAREAFYRSGIPLDSDAKIRLALLANPKTRCIAQFLSKNPTATPAEVAHSLGLADSTARWHYRRLRPAEKESGVTDRQPPACDEMSTPEAV